MDNLDYTRTITGYKGGESKPRTPVEQPDNLQSLSTMKILLALGEGEFQPNVQAQDIFLNDTPLADERGNLNFPNVTWEYRSGSQNQTYIQGFPAVENSQSLNHELRNNNVFVRAVNNTSLSAVKIRFQWPRLVEQKSNGDTKGSSVEYKVELSTDGGAYQTVLVDKVVGKTTSGYERTKRIDLPTAQSGWQVRVSRVTPDATTSMTTNTMYITGFTDVIDAKLRYPNTALLYVSFDARQFSSVPKVSVRCRGRSWPVPSNYDPESRQYSGIWDGTFKMAYTNNPVWIGYGLMIHDRFGLGKRIKPDNIDKWELYRISQYCDEMVSDGKGGMEPRFTCNMYIQSKAEAWTVLRDIAAIYRGMVYWSQSKMSSIADMPRSMDYLFTRANVVDGKFTYAGTSERSVYTRAIVSYDNPDNMYNSDATAVYDTELQRRYGDNLLEITAVGCTSQSEAQRRGKWAMYTNSKNRTVSFQVGLDGNIPMLGYIIGVADPLLAGRNIGGRLAAANSNTSFRLDRNTSAKIGDKLMINLPSGVTQERTINGVSDNGRNVTVSSSFTTRPQAEAQWAIESTDLKVQQYKVTKISKDEPHLLTITGVLHDPNKFGQVDGGARREDRPITVVPPSAQEPVTGVTLTTSTVVEQTIAVTTLTISWNRAPKAVYYVAEWRRDDGEWVSMPRTGANSVDIQGVYTGDYLARVRAFNSFDVGSVWSESMLTFIAGKTGSPPAVANLRVVPKVFGMEVLWDFPAGATDTNYTEIVYGSVPNPDTALSLGTFSYPTSTHTMTGLAAGTRFHFRARLVDKTGNIGPWSDWVDGQSSVDSEEVLSYIVGQINETHLGSELMEQLESMSDIIEYNPDMTYLKDNNVTFNNTIYNALKDVPINTPPPNAEYWESIGSIVSRLGATAALLQQTRVEVNELENGVVQAVAEAIEGVETRVGDVETMAQTTLSTLNTLDGEVNTMYSVKLGINQAGQYYAAGMGIGIENTPEGMQSQVLFLADRFSILNTINGTAVSPFTVQNGQTIINNAIIGDATINFAKINDTIQSTNYVANSTGWKLWKNGTVEINGAVAGQGRIRITNQRVEVYDNNNRLRVRLGIW